MATTDDITKAAKSKGTETLPPPGHGRDEALRMRQDSLEREIEEMARVRFMEAIDPSKFTHLDNEIAAYAHAGATIPHARPDRVYCWVEWNTRLPSDHGQHVMSKQSEGWELVHENDPDASGVTPCTITPEGHIRWGSCVLMSCDRTRYIHVQAMHRARQMMIEGQHMNASTLVELGEKYGVTVHTDLPPETIRRAQQQHRIRQQHQAAWSRIDQRLRNGTAHVPSAH